MTFLSFSMTSGKPLWLFLNLLAVKNMMITIATNCLEAAVERKFEIIGEALNRIKTEEPIILDKIRGYRSIISFRNILAPTAMIA